MSNPTDTNNEELHSDEALMAKIEYLLDTGYAADVFDFIKARDQQIALAAQVEILKRCKQSADQVFGNVKQDIYVWLDESERGLATLKEQEKS